ncbi:ataxin-7-like protein 2b isoform X2 [Sphaeramia orbicularis]|uniref:ataxin-7-like protein 2b isoform X2 n=1 Tax=Sphaeramia orbicularis TaxID=375764 RepID=UPI001180FE6D|nr:ataxin-7-like protein 2 isoform X2 [Sphaeramia orbicularis]
MAAVDRRNPNLDDFVGLNWSCWVDRVNIQSSDAFSNVEDSSKYDRNHSETMTLSKEDMAIYGHCPAHDDFFLVVCSHCGKVVKPQAFEEHCEKHHSAVTKMCGQPYTLTSQQQRLGRSPSNVTSSLPRERLKESKCLETSVRSSSNQHRSTKTQKEAVSLPPAEKFPQEKPSPVPPSSSAPRLRAQPWLSEPLLSGHCSSSSSSSERPCVQKSTAGQASEPNSSLRGTRTYSRIYKNIKKECELNKQCGGLDLEKKKLDSIPQQQRVLGRSKTSDQASAEQRTASASQDLEQLPMKSKGTEQLLDAFDEKITSRCSKYSFNSNYNILRSRDASENFPEDDGDNTVEVKVQPPYPFNQSLFSSEESEDEQEEATELPATSWHPKPMGLCTFGCRTFGCSIFTFDRRLHHLRFALSAMLEQHVNTHLWKRMPQVSTGLRSHHPTPSTLGSPVRTSTRPNPSGSLSLESTSLGKLETKNSCSNPHSTKPPSSTSSVSFGLGHERSPVGQATKARLGKVELMQNTKTAQRSTKLSHSTEDKPSKHIRDHHISEKVQPSSRVSVNGTFSKKSCPPLPLQPSERHSSCLEKSALHSLVHQPPHSSRARPPGIQQNVGSFDQRGHIQKRKSSNQSPAPRMSKCQRSSSPSCSSLLSWEKESISDVLAWGQEKRSDP